MTVPQPLSKSVLHIVRSSVFYFNYQYPLLSSRPSKSCLRLFHRLPVTLTFFSVFSSITCFRRQILCNKWSIQLAFLLFAVCRIFLSSLTLCNIYWFPTRSVQLISIHSKRFEARPLLSEFKHTDWMMDRHGCLCTVLPFYSSVWINFKRSEIVITSTVQMWVSETYVNLGSCYWFIRLVCRIATRFT